MQLKMTALGKLAAAVIFAASTAPAIAQSAGDTLLSVGWFHIKPQDSSTPLQVTSPIVHTVAGSGATVKDADTLGVSLTYFFTDNWSAALDIGIPPKYKLDGTGTLSSVGRIGTAKQRAPAVLGKYYFGDANSQFRPILGFGVARVSYTDIQLTDKFQQFTGTSFLDPNAKTSVSLKSSWAPVFTAGASYAINKDWYAALTVSYLRMRTTANLTTNSSVMGPVNTTTTLTINPIVTFLHLGYRF